MQTCSWRTRPRALPRTRHRVSPCGCPRAGPRVRLAPRSRPQQRFRSRLREHGRGVLHQVALSALPLLGAACDSGTTAPRPALVVVTPATSLLVGVGATIEFAVDVTDANGSPVDGLPVSWSTAHPSVATVDGSGLVTAVSSGMTTVEAVAGDPAGSASIEVYVPPVIDEYVPGQTYFGRNQYIEYIAGDLPVIVSAPHGGGEEPDEIPLRTYGTLVRDLGTQETIRSKGVLP